MAMFGDSGVDMDFARNANIRFVGMKTSCNNYAVSSGRAIRGGGLRDRRP
jgi:phosphoglycolate phosphatase-like HAD superfamily hydrolase